MLKKILSQLLNYDRTTRLEEESTPGPRPARHSLATTEVGSEQSSRSVHPSSGKVQIPDPWD